MRKFIVRVIFFVASILIIDRLTYTLLIYITSGSGIRFSRVLDRETDVILVGNSRGVNSVSEKYWNDNSDQPIVNLSYNGMSPLIINSLIQDISSRSREKPVFMIELTSYLKWSIHKSSHGQNCIPEVLTSQSTGLEETYLPFRSFYPTIDSLYRNDPRYKVNNFLRSLDFNSSITYRILYHFFRSDDDWVNTREITPEIIKNNEANQCITFSLKKDAFENLLSLRDRSDLELIFFVAPFHYSFSDSFVNYKESLLHLKNFYQIEINDLSNLALDKKDYADGYHTNKNGSLKLTNKLIELL